MINANDGKRCSLFSNAPLDVSRVAEVRMRMRAMGCQEHLLDYTLHTYRYTGRQLRPFLRVVSSHDGRPVKMVQISPPDTNTTRKSTNESILSVDVVGGGLEHVSIFLTGCKYQLAFEQKMAGFQYDILSCTLDVVSIDNSGVMLVHLFTMIGNGVKEGEDRLYRVAEFLKDIVRLVHPDNSFLKSAQYK